MLCNTFNVLIAYSEKIGVDEKCALESEKNQCQSE